MYLSVVGAIRRPPVPPFVGRTMPPSTWSDTQQDMTRECVVPCEVPGDTKNCHSSHASWWIGLSVSSPDEPCWVSCAHVAISPPSAPPTRCVSLGELQESARSLDHRGFFSLGRLLSRLCWIGSVSHSLQIIEAVCECGRHMPTLREVAIRRSCDRDGTGPGVQGCRIHGEAYAECGTE